MLLDITKNFSNKNLIDLILRQRLISFNGLQEAPERQNKDVHRIFRVLERKETYRGR